MRAFHAEAVKFFTTRLWLWLGLVLVGLTGLLTFLIVNAVNDAATAFDDFVAADMADLVAALAPLAYVVATVLGIIALTGEYRHQTITPTFLTVPQRWVVLAAKLAFYFVIGGICGLLFTLVVGAIAFPGLDGKGYDISLGDQVVAGSFRGVILVSALFGMFGVAVGALLRNQAFAITAVVLYHFVIENILQVIPTTADIYPYLPGGAARAVMYEDVEPAVEGVDMLSASQSAFVIVAWALALAGVGLLTSLNRDVT